MNSNAQGGLRDELLKESTRIEKAWLVNRFKMLLPKDKKNGQSWWLRCKELAAKRYFKGPTFEALHSHTPLLQWEILFNAGTQEIEASSMPLEERWSFHRNAKGEGQCVRMKLGLSKGILGPAWSKPLEIDLAWRSPPTHTHVQRPSVRAWSSHQEVSTVDGVIRWKAPWSNPTRRWPFKVHRTKRRALGTPHTDIFRPQGELPASQKPETWNAESILSERALVRRWHPITNEIWNLPELSSCLADFKRGKRSTNEFITLWGN
jgi:hypothetical protein